MTASTRHRWGPRVECGPYKSEKTCLRCDVTRASMHQHAGGAHDEHWKEYWRDGERVDGGDGSHVPPCDARLERKLDAARLERKPDAARLERETADNLETAS